MNLKRMYSLIVAQNKATRLENLLVITGLFVLYYMIDLFGGDEEPLRTHPLIMGYFAIYIVARFNLHIYVDKGTHIAWLSLPASQTEKWTSCLVYTAIICPLICTLIAMTVVVATYFSGELTLQEQQHGFNYSTQPYFRGFLNYWSMHAPLFFGAVYFMNSPLIKSFVSAIVLIVLFAAYSLYLITSTGLGDSIVALKFNGAPPQKLLETTQPTIIAILVFVTLFCWLLSFIRLKEIDV